MKKQEIKKVDLWYDKTIRMWGATFKDSKNNNIIDPEFGQSKTTALKNLMQNAPETLFYPVKSDYRDY